MAIEKHRKAGVMLINPPVISPAMPSLNSAMVAGCLSDSNINVLQYDTNLDFFLNHVLAKNRMNEYIQMIEAKKKAGIINKSDYDVIDQLFKRIENTDISLDVLKTDSFFKPEKLMKVKEQIDDLLLLFSYAFFPSRIRWASFSSNSNIAPDSCAFDPLCKEEFSSRLIDSNPDIVIFFVSSQSQIAATKTMTSFVKSSFPRTKAIVISAIDLSVSSDSEFDQVFPMKDYHPLFNYLENFFEIKIDPTNIFPDFAGLPLKDYLTPQLVLPLNSSCINKQKSILRIMEQTGAKGFIVEDENFDFDLMAEKFEKEQEILFSLKKSMDNPLDPEPDHLKAFFDRGMLMVQWGDSTKEIKLLTKQLWDVSKQGIWNHINIPDHIKDDLSADLLVFLSSNPNIAHSYKFSDVSGAYNELGIKKIDSSLQPYSITAPLPGKPLWETFSDPVHLLLYLEKFGKKKMFCMRYDSEKNSVFSLGDNITFHFKKPDDLPAGFLDEICKMVEAGGSVNTKFVRSNLEKAYLIAYAMENGVIVGNSSLKHPREAFIKRINAITGFDFNHFVERGYTSVRPEYRALGVGARLLEGLTSRVENYKIFSLISEDNKATQKIAIRNKTKKIATYFSDKVGKEMEIWMPEHMIEQKQDIK
jgi:hypothetical protein